MTTGDWRARVVQARAQYDDLLAPRVWGLRKDGHEATINLRPVSGVGAEIVPGNAAEEKSRGMEACRLPVQPSDLLADFTSEA